jgi:hypothetical protein
MAFLFSCKSIGITGTNSGLRGAEFSVPLWTASQAFKTREQNVSKTQ